MSSARADINREAAHITLTLTGSWRRDDKRPTAERLIRSLTDATHLRLVAESIADWDSSLVNVALQLQRHCDREGLSCEISLPDGAARLLHLALAVPPAAHGAKQPEDGLDAWFRGLFSALQPRTLSRRIGAEIFQLAEFVGALLTAASRALTGNARTRVIDALRFGFQTGPNALPIISLTSFLVGMILGYLGAVQLQQFGAGIYVANLVTVGVLREMGALMTAIIIAGRTGAAYAAQLGTMRVNEEVDAIEILGVSAVEFLVLPRVLAVIVMVPLLTVYANVLGIAGGGIVASGLGISPLQYWTQVQGSLGFDHLLVGLTKAVLFGALIGIAGCRAGLRSGRDSEGVGRATTTAVVVALIYLIVADALVNVFCQLLEI